MSEWRGYPVVTRWYTLSTRWPMWVRMTHHKLVSVWHRRPGGPPLVKSRIPPNFGPED